MQWKSIRDPDIRAKYLGMTRKTITHRWRGKCDSYPVFVLGKQRSGTSMLMFCFHRHPGVLVFDENRSNRAFDNYRLRNASEIKRVIQSARLPFVCFKPICDSHLVSDMIRDYPDGRFIWMYRDFRDVAASSLRKFEAPTRAIRLVCNGQEGGGWFQEGVSPGIADVLRRVYRPDLSAFELSCLVWWARNRIVFEQGITEAPNLTFLRYEALVGQPEITLTWLFARLGVPYDPRVANNIRSSSVGRHPPEIMDLEVSGLCEQLMTDLDRVFYGMFPGAGVRNDQTVQQGVAISDEVQS